jgi:hypothetical protein
VLTLARECLDLVRPLEGIVHAHDRVAACETHAVLSGVLDAPEPR